MMADKSEPEYWLRGPVSGVPSLLQPVAHALLQSVAEIISAMKEVPESMIWESPAGVASPVFHLQHIPGVIDRLFTYANGEMLNPQQLICLRSEGIYNAELSSAILIEQLKATVYNAIEKLKNISEDSLADTRFVGRQKIPSTVSGLLFHSAEHTMRHTGQLLVTVKWILYSQRNLSSDIS